MNKMLKQVNNLKAKIIGDCHDMIEEKIGPFSLSRVNFNFDPNHRVACEFIVEDEDCETFVIKITEDKQIIGCDVQSLPF
jgi:hypothetical protein